VGLVTIHAAVTFSGQSGGHLQRFEGLGYVLIKAPVEYRLTRLLATDLLERSFEIRPSFVSEISVNDAGQLAFIANLDGLAGALMLYEAGQFDVVASLGTPGPAPASYIYHFENPPSINNKGEVLVRYSAMGGAGLMLASRSGTAVLPQGFSLGTLEQLTTFRVARASLNDRGDIAFLADYTLQGTRRQSTALFRVVDGEVLLVWSNADPLPDFPADYSFVNPQFGQDAEGNVYFLVQAGSNGAVYKAAASGSPVKVLGTGTSVGGATVQTVNQLVMAANGGLAMKVSLRDGKRAVARLQVQQTQVRSIILRDVGNVFGITESGEVFYTGDPGVEPWWGMWRWPANGPPTQIAASGARFEAATYNWARSGAITSKGELFADITTPDGDFVVVRPDTGRVLFKSGNRIQARLPLNFMGLVPGAITPPVHIFAGTGHPSLMEVLPGGLKPLWVPGDRPFLGLTSSSITYATKDATGAIYLAAGDGIMRFQGSRVEALVRFPVQISNENQRVTINGHSGWFNGSTAFAVNRTGTLVWNANAGNHNRLMIFDRGVLTSIMIQGGPNQTASPGGGRFTGIAGGSWHQNTVAIDDRGRVFVNARVNGGPNGLFLYENGGWKTAALFGTTRVLGATVSGAVAVHASGEKFYAVLDVPGGRAIGEYDGQQWNLVVKRTDITPDGIEVGNLQALSSVNYRGDIAFIATGTRTRIGTRTADGKLHVVYSALETTQSGSALWPSAYVSLQLHDDGRLYIVGLDTSDRNTVHVAEPLF
jgi:hypothetical protein